MLNDHDYSQPHPDDIRAAASRMEIASALHRAEFCGQPFAGADFAVDRIKDAGPAFVDTGAAQSDRSVEARTVLVSSKPVSCDIWHQRLERDLPNWCADLHRHQLAVVVVAAGKVLADGRPFVNARLLTEFAANFLEELDGSNLNDCPHLAAPTMEAVARLAEERFVSFFARIGDVVALHAVSVSFADAGESILHLAVSNKISGPAGRN